MATIVYFVVPCYNEEDVLPITCDVLAEKVNALITVGKISPESKVMFVDDGSKDNTWRLIDELHHKRPDIFSGVKLSRNKGHQNALLAGLMTAKNFADVTISMDADLQDDVDAVDRMLESYENGYEVVYGVRSSRKTDTVFKRNTAQMFYKLMSFLGADVVYNHADYRLMSRRAVEGLGEFREVNLFLRGIVPLVGYKSTTVEYERGERQAGESKYPLKKMLEFSLNGITSFSIKPIRFITTLGFLILIFSLIMIIYSIVTKIIGTTVQGWSGLMCSIWLIGGLQIFSIGMVGEYIGKIYMETKQRPKYIIEAVLDKKSKEKS